MFISQKFEKNLLFLHLYSVVAQSYEVEADNEYVIRGNSAVMKCEIPSFVSDYIIVESWADSQGNTFLPDEKYGKLLLDLGCIVSCKF